MKNKFIAAILAFLGGWLGLHKFYLGKIGTGIIYILFTWTGIPAFVAFFEGILFLVMDNRVFDAKFNRRLSAAPMQGSFQGSPSYHHESTKEKVSALGELKKLYEADIITAEEFEGKRRKILDSI